MDLCDFVDLLNKNHGRVTHNRLCDGDHSILLDQGVSYQDGVYSCPHPVDVRAALLRVTRTKQAKDWVWDHPHDFSRLKNGGSVQVYSPDLVPYLISVLGEMGVYVKGEATCTWVQPTEKEWGLYYARMNSGVRSGNPDGNDAPHGHTEVKHFLVPVRI